LIGTSPPATRRSGCQRPSPPLSLAEPAFAGSLGAFPLPKWENFQLQVTEVKGLGQESALAGFEHLGLFLKLHPLSTFES